VFVGKAEKNMCIFANDFVDEDFADFSPFKMLYVFSEIFAKNPIPLQSIVMEAGVSSAISPFK